MLNIANISLTLLPETIIGSVVCEPNKVIPGQNIVVDVLSLDGQSYDGNNDVIVTINGIRGAKQHIQFEFPGNYNVLVEAVKDSLVEKKIVAVEVMKVEDGSTTHPPDVQIITALINRPEVGTPLIRIAKSPSQFYNLGFTLGRQSFYFTRGLSKGPFITKPEQNPLNNFKVAGTTTFGNSGLLNELTISPKEESATGIKYHWDFGDGTSIITTTDPGIEHDFESALGPDDEHRNFHVKVRIELPTGESTELLRTLSVYNGYAICKRLGTIIPKISGTGSASRIFSGYEGDFIIENIENFPLQLTTRRVLAVLPEDDLLEIEPEEQLNSPIIVNANSSVTVSSTVTEKQLPIKATGFTVIYGGTAGQQQIRVEAHFDIPLSEQNKVHLKIGNIAVTHFKPIRNAILPPPDSPVNLDDLITPPNNFQSLVGNASRLLKPDSNMIRTSRALFDVLNSGLLDRNDYLNIVTSVPVENGECDPDNIPDDLTDWACQATSEQRQIPIPGRFMNARKGDIILSPGGMGPIGGLLRQLVPPQKYSHCGIMTRNYDQITNSTCSEERIEAYPVGTDPTTGEPAATDGHRPDIVKYGWPGVVTQSVDASIHGFTVLDAVRQGGLMLDPETANLEEKDRKWYSISSFSPHNEFMEIGKEWQIVPPLVVKPDPMKETSELRRKLHEVADDALSQTGKSHYRFFCYTDPTIGQRMVSSSEVGNSTWAANTFGSVCSSFLWLILKKHEIHLESASQFVSQQDLEQKDKTEAKAKVRSDTLDGLYLYSAQDRLSAANYLYNYLYDKAYSKAGFLGRLLTDAPDDIGNQIVNTFAKDWADGDSKNNDDWREDLQDANAVSPDNIMLWDGPEQNGLYGYVAPLVYREPRIETVTIYRWRLVPTKGSLQGVVLYQGQPIAGAIVQLYDGLQDFTDQNGFYKIENISIGNYVVKAAKDPDANISLYRTADLPVTIEPIANMLDINLHGPPDLFRVLKVSGSMHIVDFETFGDDEVADRPLFRELFVGPFSTHAEALPVIEKMGGEVRVELRIVADWQIDKSINVSYDLKFYEGASEDTDDLDGETSQPFNLQADWWRQWISTIHSPDAGEVKLDATFENAINPN